MDFSPSPEAKELVDLVGQLCTAHAPEESLAELDARFGPGTETAGTTRDTARIHTGLWHAMRSSGVIQALAPATAGGEDLGYGAAALVFHELGKRLSAVPLDTALIGAQLCGAAQHPQAQTLATGEQIVAAPDIVTGVHNPAAGGGTEVHLPAVAWAPIADVLCIPGAGSLLTCALPADNVTINRLVPVDFSCSAQVSVPRAALTTVELDPAHLELAQLRQRLQWAAYQWGVLDEALQRTARYASERVQFGRPIGTFQAVSSRLADGLIDVDAVRLSVLRAASELDNCRDAQEASDTARNAVAAAHFWACEAGHRVAHTAVHVHGGTGLDRSEPVHRYFLAAKAGEFRGGGAQAQLIEMGRLLVAHGDPWE